MLLAVSAPAGFIFLYAQAQQQCLPTRQSCCVPHTHTQYQPFVLHKDQSPRIACTLSRAHNHTSRRGMQPAVKKSCMNPPRLALSQLCRSWVGGSWDDPATNTSLCTSQDMLRAISQAIPLHWRMWSTPPLQMLLVHSPAMAYPSERPQPAGPGCHSQQRTSLHLLACLPIQLADYQILHNNM